MSKYVEGYQDFTNIKTKRDGQIYPFIDYLVEFHSPPTHLITDAGQEVPLRGLMSILAVGRVLADTDILGGYCSNAGIIWCKDANGEVIEAQAVKIDPGECFKFSLKVEPERLTQPSENWALNTIEAKKGTKLNKPRLLEDLKDIQTAQNDDRVLIHWAALTVEQREEFIATLLNCGRYLNFKDILNYLFYRDNSFKLTPEAQFAEEVATQYQTEMQAWLKTQLKIYAHELAAFKKAHPEILLRMHYIDKWGEISVPMAEETLPIRELFVNLRLVKDKPRDTKRPLIPMLAMDLKHSSSQAIALEKLFDPMDGKPPRTILLTGSAGIGKSTLCQKIAHDWASGRLWKDRFEAIYWLPLRELNNKQHNLIDPIDFLQWALATLGFEKEIISINPRSLILLDGYDEATPVLQELIRKLVKDQRFTIFLTSRPGMVDALNPLIDLRIENHGFSDEQLRQYTQNFFARKNATGSHLPLLQAIRSQAQLWEIAHTPLYAQMLCTLWEKRKESFASHLTGLYQQMVDHLLLWNRKKLEHLDQKELLLRLGTIAQKGLMDDQLVIPEFVIRDVLKNSPFTGDHLLLTGLLKKSADGQFYFFLHLSFQEYLTAYKMAQASQSIQREFIQTHQLKDIF